MAEFWASFGIGAGAGAIAGFFGAIWLLDRLTQDIEDDKREWRKKCDKALKKKAKKMRKTR